MEISRKKTLIFYHSGCPDGFAGALAAWLKFKESAEYIPLKHQTAPPIGLRNKNLIFIDIVYPEAMMRKLVKYNDVIAIDHHISAERAVKTAQKFCFSLKNSGSVLAWKYFHPQKSIPVLFKHLEDFDLWKFKLPKTREVLAFVETLDFDFREWTRAVGDFESKDKKAKHLEKGKIILKYENKLVKDLVDNNSTLVNFAGHKALSVNSPEFISEIGEVLLKKMPPIGIIWSVEGLRKRISIRSDGTVDVSRLAKKYGGGGHKTGAGFAMPLDAKMPWKTIKNKK